MIKPCQSFLAVAAGLALSACGVPDGTVITDCVNKGTMRPVCGIQSPEDIAIAPGGDYLLLSELGNMGAYPGQIIAFKVEDQSWEPVYPGEDTPPPTALQGDPECTAAPGSEISPHGTHIVQLDDDSWRYLVVNHGGREAIELFAVGSTREGKPTLAWQGCVFPADNTLINDVVGLANGDVIYTRMYHPDDFLGEARGIIGLNSGDVWRWSGTTGLKRLPGTEGALTNGIEISKDERYVFINQYMDKEVQKYDLQTEQVVGRAAVAHVDNSAWGPDGQLWLTRHLMETAVYLACTRDHQSTCGMAFEVVALDPTSMESRVIFQHQGPPMGAATVATAHRDMVYLGSFLGDRLLIVPIDNFDQ